jgi:hypothetical protein
MDSRKQLAAAEKLLPTPALISVSIVASVEGAAGKSAIFSALNMLLDAGVQMQFRARPVSEVEKTYAQALQKLSIQAATGETLGRDDAGGPEGLAEDVSTPAAQPVAASE